MIRPLFEDLSRLTAYEYNQSAVDARWEHQGELGRIHLAVMLAQEPIGEVLLKDVENDVATLSIHMKNDSFKNHGYGTQAEILTLNYAFHVLKMNTIYADVIHKNTRSMHVLEKVGFQRIRSNERYVYYRCDRETWISANANVPVHDLL